jgi:hypothetical protein
MLLQQVNLADCDYCIIHERETIMMRLCIKLDYKRCAGLAIVAASLTCGSGIPSAEELFKWLVYASEGTCLRTRPHSGKVDEGCLRNPREWPAALASSLEARILAVCPQHIACWDVASAQVLLQPTNAVVPTPLQPGKRTRRGRRNSKKQAQGADTAAPLVFHSFCVQKFP